MIGLRTLGLFVAISVVACQPVQQRGGASRRGSSADHGGGGSAHHGGGGSGRLTLAVLPAESQAYPHAARALTDSLTHAEVDGVGKKHVSKVSLEVVQLSIECVEPSAKCYAAVGKSLSANRLLFAQIQNSNHRHVEVTVTLFDVDAREPRTAKKVFATEQAATAGMRQLVAEATR